MVSFGQTLEYRHVSVDTGLAKSLTLIAVGTAFFFPPLSFSFSNLHSEKVSVHDFYYYCTLVNKNIHCRW